MGHEKRHEIVPYGPLTRADFVRLAGSFYQGGPRDGLLAVIRQRGITKKDFPRLYLDESRIRMNTDGNKTKADLGGAGAGQSGFELPE